MNHEKEARDIFLERFRQLRKPDETQNQFANRIGLARSTVALYETGKRTPDIETLDRICRVCGCSADWLIGISDTKSPEMDIQGVVKYTGLWEDAVNKLIEIKGKEESFLLSTLIADSYSFRRFLQKAAAYMSQFSKIRMNQVKEGKTDSFDSGYFNIDVRLIELNSTINLESVWINEMQRELDEIPHLLLVHLNRCFYVHYCCNGVDPEDNSINPLQRYFEKTVLKKD